MVEAQGCGYWKQNLGRVFWVDGTSRVEVNPIEYTITSTTNYGKDIMLSDINVTVGFGLSDDKDFLSALLKLFGQSEPEIKKIVHVKDRTITYWNDGDIVKSKCMPGDTYNKEYGLLVCIMKKLWGSWSEAEQRMVSDFTKNAKVMEVE